MEEKEKIDKEGMYGAEREIKSIENRIIEGLRSREERKRLREGIGIEIMRKRGRKRQIKKGKEHKTSDISKVKGQTDSKI